ncbi:ATP-binding protein [Roseateles asaccharophilus]|uniref:NadR type nicotinamide-nucleotide adenylyltransferase n=1 Tax=Roseateles asaccharophilus TaxID=582607 RepID=A0ABU2ABB1_9BURK|nr:ATP-binding protein [Roseateles asaccharophilus]MDR7334481.1 NadR type nicotinamide-nucleotide adenylyltransferase [Roseateles asaccharophilus]
MSARRVALLGAECTGKSTLAEALARHFNAGLVTEYLREWCDTHGRTPQRHEQAHIAAVQAERIEAAAREHTLVICDTTPLITALCSEHYFDDDSLTAEALAFQRRCDLTLLCAPDLPWAADGFLRDGPAVRERFDGRIRTALTAGGIAWIDIVGSDAERSAAAIAAVQRPNSR